MSLNDPSNLPLFDGLAQQIARSLGVEYDATLSPDRFLGQLTQSYPLVREHVRAIIGSAESRANANHLALARLAAAIGAPIVTTNYDLHVQKAAAEASLELGDTYSGPAVPLGKDFQGLVYLHGASSRPAAELVVTDDDFGRAYLTDGWARRFVQDLFEHRTVLFVGYSHSDVVMTYLARGLPPSAQPRFALTHEPDSPRWENLRITPVAYPGDEEHAALPRALEAWAALMNMGVLEHYARAKDIAAGSPPAVPEEADYLADVLNTPAGARGFAAVATGYEWLRWAEEQPVFRRLFEVGRAESESSRVLADWFVSQYVAVPEYSMLALGALARLGPVVSTELQWEISRAARGLRSTAPEDARRWMTILTAVMRTDPAESSLSWFQGYGNPLSGGDALPLLRRALVPRLILREDRPWFPIDEDETQPRRVSAEIEWATSDDVLKVLWEQVSEEGLEIADTVLQIAEQALTDAYELLRAFDPERTFDPWSFRRSAIEPHEQDRFSDEEGTIIDMLRDSALRARSSSSDLSARWLSSPYALFRRLGLHLIAESPHLSGDEKCATVLGGLLYDPEAKHELFRLLQLVAPDLSPDSRQRLLASVLAGPPNDDPVEGVDARPRRRAIFDRAEWLSRYAESPWPELDAAISDIRRDEPDMGVRTHPDLDHYMTSGTWGGKMPLTVDEFLTRVREDGARASVQSLLVLDYSERNFDDPTWEDACKLVREAAAAQPSVGLQLLPEVMLAPFARHHDLLGAIMHGWSQSSVLLESINDLVGALEEQSVRPELARPVSEVLNSVSKPAEGDLVPLAMEKLDALAVELWEMHAPEFDPGGWSDLLMRGLNTWPGILAQYWLNRVAARWQAAPEQWEGLTEIESRAFSLMLTSPTSTRDTAASILSWKLHFLFAADPQFTAARVFPLFDSDVSAFAPDAWFSFLHEPRTSPDLLDAGFWQLLLRSVDAATGRDQGMAERYWATVASIAAFSTASTVDRLALIDYLATPQRAGQLVAFIRALGHAVTDLDDAGRESLWSSWLESAIATRQAAAPGVQSPEERTAWGDLALELGTEDALTLTTSCPGAIGARTRFHHLDPARTQLIVELLVRVVTARLRLTETADWHIRSELEQLFERVKADAAPASLRQLAELAVQRGVHEALSWVDA
ncbi:SIR2 family protein [Microbacterium sp. TNHR37B]|uniref:SIR2 family protein n=1 Tax=Microbacterium sp. TNHR37B TaxID=1775956 RepID=UPI0018D2BE0C|nr:SIR2 family protein [Microbacterium sp. TNHR37B]